MTRQLPQPVWLFSKSLPRLSFVLALPFILGSMIIATQEARAQSFSVLYTFTGGLNSGGNPLAGVVLDSSGNLYGTTEDGGSGL